VFVARYHINMGNTKKNLGEELRKIGKEIKK